MTAPTLKLVGLTGHGEYPVPPGRPLLVGRGSAADLVIRDTSVSRHHAEIEATTAGLRTRDLGSANGVLVNGAPVTEAVVRPGDIVAFGRPAFRVTLADGVDREAEAAPNQALESLIAVTPGAMDDAAVLDRLLGLARELAGEPDARALLALVAELTFRVVPADRVAVLLREGPEQVLLPAQSRSRVGPAEAVRVPRAIADRAVAERRPVMTVDALDDDRLRSGSVVASRVRSAIAVPMTGVDQEIVGVVYADRIASAVPFGEPEARAVLAFAALAGASVARAHLSEALRRQETLRHNLERFLAPDAAAAVAAAGAALAAGGERRVVTVVFSDIRGFTHLAERLAPEAVAEILTEYFATMAEVIFAHGGTLDKFLGDGLLAVWGTPSAAPGGDAGCALAAARAMRDALHALTPGWQRRGYPALAAGTGMARGEVFAGRIGGEQRLDHTVIGDAVNVAARLCELAGPGEILLTDEVRRALDDTGALRPHPGVELRGRDSLVTLWTG